MADSDNAVIGYTFFEPETGIARFVRLIILPFRKAWETDPTIDDISGIDKSMAYLPKVPFDLSSPEDMHRGRLVQYVRDTLGRDLSAYVNDLPDGYISNCLYNVAYDRPMQVDALRLRIGDTLVINPYGLSAYYLTMWLLRAFAAELTASPMNSLKSQGVIVTNLADHLQFAIDRILVKFNISEPDNGTIVEGFSFSTNNNAGEIVAKNTTLYVAETPYNQWLAKGGSAELFVADWGLNYRVPDDTTITNQQDILIAWAAAQNPPSS